MTGFQCPADRGRTVADLLGQHMCNRSTKDVQTIWVRICTISTVPLMSTRAISSKRTTAASGTMNKQ
eukprot:scaffold77666_cov40-Tisochrysis_lutea.AAC.1